jgi:hypothetical protein
MLTTLRASVRTGEAERKYGRTARTSSAGRMALTARS